MRRLYSADRRPSLKRPLREAVPKMCRGVSVGRRAIPSGIDGVRCVTARVADRAGDVGLVDTRNTSRVPTLSMCDMPASRLRYRATEMSWRERRAPGSA